jgi:hypothetical protein
VDDEGDPVLAAPRTPRGTVEAAVALSDGGGPVKRRNFALLTGAAVTVPAHHWLIREPGPLVSGLSGARVSGALVAQMSEMIAPSAEVSACPDIHNGPPSNPSRLRSLAR